MTAGADRREEAVALWAHAYQGEVGGEVLFAAMAARAGDPAVARKLKVLTMLERDTKQLLAGALRRWGVPTEPDPTVVADNEQHAQRTTYAQLLRDLPPINAEYLASYARLRKLVDGEDAAVVDQVIAHELALEVFVRRELAGAGEDAVDAIRVLAHVDLGPDGAGRPAP